MHRRCCCRPAQEVMDYTWFRASFLSISSNTPPHFFTPGTPTPSFSTSWRSFFTFFLRHFFFTLFLATSFSLIQPGGLSGCQQERKASSEDPPPLLHPCNRLRTKATKHACVNISVAWAPRPGSRCSLSAGPRWSHCASNSRLFCAVCCRTWLVCCGEAAVPACMQWQRRGLGFDVSLRPSGGRARSSALARRAQFTSFSPPSLRHQGWKIHFKWAADNYSVRSRHLLAPLSIGQSMRSAVTIGHLFEMQRLIGSQPGGAQCINSSTAFALFSGRKVVPLLLGCCCSQWDRCAPKPPVDLAASLGAPLSESSGSAGQ